MRDEPYWVCYNVCKICGEWFDPKESGNKEICDKCLKKGSENMNELTVRQNNDVTIQSLNPDAVLHQVKQIQDLMKSAMKKGEHYDKIPGTKKPTLLKAGAEKISFMFRLVPEFKEERIDLPNGHREFIVKCRLRHLPTGQYWGEGLGSCSTMESKFRYRTGEVVFTGKPVPQEYWDNRDQKLIGGKGFGVKKNPETGKWEIVRAGQKVENENISDTYNTVLKIAKKRAYNDAVITATAASDIFTQDVEDIKENLKAMGEEIQEAEVIDDNPEPPKQEPEPKPETQAQDNEPIITEKQRKRLFAISKQKGVSHEQVKEIIGQYGYEKTVEIKRKDYDRIIEAVEHFND